MSIIIGLSTFMFAGCTNSNIIRVNEVTRSVFYAPFYVAINKGYFEEYGYKIQLTTGGGSDASMTALLSGSADVALMGPETNVYVKSQGKQNAPLIFGQLTKKDGSFLVGRVDEPNFDWNNLNGKYIIAGRKGGSPAMSLQVALEKHGYNIATDLTFDTGVSFNNTAGAFEGGLGDYVTMFEPTASEYVKAGKGYIVASVGQESGEIPFTCFSATPSYLKQNKDKIKAFLTALVKAYNFIITADIDDVVTALMPSFSGASTDSIKTAVQNYIAIDAWKSTPAMLSDDFDRLQDMLVGAGTLNKSDKVTFQSVVDNSFANSLE